MSELLRTLKQTPASSIDSSCIPIHVKGKIRGRLRPITFDTLQNRDEIIAMAEWREAYSEWFATRFPVSEESTRRWLEHVLHDDQRILFFVDDEENTPVGQIGLFGYDEEKKTCEFDNLLRGRKGKFGNIMIYALITLGKWSIETLDMEEGYLHVFADNQRALRMHRDLGAVEIKRDPLVRTEENGVIRWIPAPPGTNTPPEREMVTSRIKRETFLQLFKQNDTN